LTLFYQILASPNTFKTCRRAFQWFIASSACVHKIMEHVDDLSKVLG